MKDDYLWDKTGEADPQIEHLERVLGQMRGQREAPKDLMRAFDAIPRTRPRAFSKALLIAASLAFALLTLAVFASLQREARQARATALAMLSPVPTEQPLAPVNNAAIKDEQRPVEVSTATSRQRPAFASGRRGAARNPVASATERAEGLMAKEQLLKALEITSSNLNVVQKKVQGKSTLGPSS